MKDTDQDGCSDGDEVMDMNTNPLAVDTDGDGAADIVYGGDPKLEKLLKFFRENRGFMTRGYGLNGRWAFENGLKVGVNNLSTDMVTGQSWAKVGDRPFARAAG